MAPPPWGILCIPCDGVASFFSLLRGAPPSIRRYHLEPLNIVLPVLCVCDDNYTSLTLPVLMVSDSFEKLSHKLFFFAICFHLLLPRPTPLLLASPIMVHEVSYLTLVLLSLPSDPPPKKFRGRGYPSGDSERSTGRVVNSREFAIFSSVFTRFFHGRLYPLSLSDPPPPLHFQSTIPNEHLSPGSFCVKCLSNSPLNYVPHSATPPLLCWPRGRLNAVLSPHTLTR